MEGDYISSMSCLLCLLLVLGLAYPTAAFFDPLSIGSAIAIGSGMMIYQFGYCKIAECCTENWITANFTKLRTDLASNLFGQHLVSDVVVRALSNHFHSSKKALALSFHGLPGVGKNYVSKFVVDSLYRNGPRSQYVHLFTGKIHFPLQERAAIYRMQLQDWVRGNVSICPRSLFMFDEVDKMPRGILDGLKPFLDYHEEIDGVDFRKAIFIFMSNTGGNLIARRHLELWKSGKKREELQLRDFEVLIKKGAFNEEGGFHKSEAIDSALIDLYVPFLPLEESHVRLCIKERFRYRGVSDAQEEHIQEVLKDVIFGPEGVMKFSNTGCKGIDPYVVQLIDSLSQSPKD